MKNKIDLTDYQKECLDMFNLVYESLNKIDDIKELEDEQILKLKGKLKEIDGKLKEKTKPKNISISSEEHNIIKNYCGKSYNIGEWSEKTLVSVISNLGKFICIKPYKFITNAGECRFINILDICDIMYKDADKWTKDNAVAFTHQIYVEFDTDYGKSYDYLHLTMEDFNDYFLPVSNIIDKIAG